MSKLEIRGYQIEPGKIELTLLENPCIQDAVVIAREDNPGERRLVAYVIANRKPTQVELWPSVGEYPIYDEILYYSRLEEYFAPKS
jgi:acyl-coenzyme A synthetase/AMP-(fatty) acid ligase